ncbi:hypothetical protein [Agromyces neolithicus]|uniref:Uncharacterized protein n=1 Tax=Agromyces neolithicus TaxID=269420 RepID=A0ABN2LTW9_9MICO
MQRLVRAITTSSPDAFVLIAHDARQTKFPVRLDDPRVEIFDHGLATDWGSWELVEATLLAFERVRTLVDPQLVCLISGQDYPVRRLTEWESEAIAADSWTGVAEELSYTPRWGRRRGQGRDELTRYIYRWFRSPAAHLGIRLTGTWGRRLRRIRGAIALRAEPLFSVRVVERGRGVHYGIRRVRTPFSPERPCYFGSQWVALRRRELDWLLDDDLAPGSPLRRLYQRSVIPDESALVTPLAWRALPTRLGSVTHVTWDPVLDQPTTCTLADLDDLLRSGSPFCRKVEPAASRTLMDALDRIVGTGYPKVVSWDNPRVDDERD